jgi:lipid-binding SYLF domain-containing protein
MPTLWSMVWMGKMTESKANIGGTYIAHKVLTMSIPMFGNLLKRGPPEEDSNADAGHVHGPQIAAHKQPSFGGSIIRQTLSGFTIRKIATLLFLAASLALSPVAMAREDNGSPTNSAHSRHGSPTHRASSHKGHRTSSADVGNCGGSSNSVIARPNPDAAKTMAMAKAALDEVVASYQVDRGKITDLVTGSQGFAVLHNVVKAGFIYAEIHGPGFLVYRQADGRWGPPLLLEVSGISYGPQIGAQVSDVLMVFKTTETIRKLLTGEFSHGLLTPSGPVLNASSDTVSLPSGIVTYSLHRGLMLGQSVDQYHLRLLDQANLRLYGKPLKSGEILSFTRDCHQPGPVQEFVEHANTQLGKPSNEVHWNVTSPTPN